MRHGAESYELRVPVFAKGGRPPEQAVEYRTQSATRNQLQVVELKLAPTVAPALWNLNMQWMGLYLIVAFAFGFGLRKVLGVQ